MNGKFKIRPNIELHAFEVECEFGETGGKTVLKPVQWNEEGFVFPPSENKRCSEANCFIHNFSYTASDEQIETITNMSTTCSQSIKHICTVNSLSGTAIQTERVNRHFYLNNIYRL